jgi:type IV secretory pathway VirB6-like protein
VKKIKILLLLVIIFLLSGCDCNCKLIDTTIKPSVDGAQSSLTIWADGCSSSSGVTQNGYPAGSCDGVNQYLNRGRWVQVPNIIPNYNTRLNITTYGSIYFCSTGYDNQVNPAPSLVVYPSSSPLYTMSNNSKIPVVPGQQVLVSIIADQGTVSNSVGVTIGSNTASIANSCTNYSDFLSGKCRGYKGYGLSIYVENNKIVTLDETYNANNQYGFKSAASRKANLLSYVPSNDLSSVLDITKTYQNVDISSAVIGNYTFIVPDGIKGNIGFSIADGPYAQGTGQYTVKVYTTPPACYVENAVADSTPGQRGAIELVVSKTNPNDFDSAVSAFNALNSGNEMTVYYPELIAYINSYSGIQTNGATALSGLVVDSATVLNPPPLIITTSSYVLNTIDYYGGNIWLKVRDDYYSDNVGSYYVEVDYSYDVPSSVSKFINSLITPIVNSFWQLSGIMYSNFGTVHYLNIVRMCLLIYIMVYGAQFALGLVRVSSYDLLFRIIKIGVVVELFHVADSWDFFSQYFFNFFKYGMDQLIRFVTGDYSSNKAGIFAFVDQMFELLFSNKTWIKIMALFPSLIGVIYMFMIIGVITNYVLLLARVIVSYLLVIIGMALLLSLAPIFFVLMLFRRTKRYFDNWINHLADYALQPIINFGFLYLLTNLFVTFWNNLMNFEVCWGSVLNLYFDLLYKYTDGIIPVIPLGCMTFYNVKGGINYFEMFMNVNVISMFIFAMKNLMSHVPEITRTITGVSTAVRISQTANDVLQRSMDNAQAAVKNVGSALGKGANFASNISRGRKGGQGNGEE